MLVNFVHKGMTREQVKQIFGEGYYLVAILTAGGTSVTWRYYDLGLTFDFDSYNKDVVRLTEVRIWPLLP